jgi:putative tricarboxylic transport membrane protein
MPHNQKDFFAGLMFIAFGAAGYTFAQEYPFGTATRMGPGYFPTVLSLLLLGIGVVSSFRAFRGATDAIDKIFIKKTIAVVVPVLVFGAIVKGAGLVPATIVVVIGSAMASAHFHAGKAALLSIGMAAFCWAVFSWGLGLPLPAFGPWLVAN